MAAPTSLCTSLDELCGIPEEHHGHFVLGFAGFCQITMRKADGWRSLNERPSDQTVDLAAPRHAEDRVKLNSNINRDGTVRQNASH